MIRIMAYLDFVRFSEPKAYSVLVITGTWEILGKSKSSPDLLKRPIHSTVCETSYMIQSPEAKADTRDTELPRAPKYYH